jgi:serine O-acetyltransferase
MKSDTPFRQDRKHFYSVRYNTENPPFFSKLKLCLTDFGLHSVAVYRLGSASLKLYNKSKIIGLIPIAIYKLLNFFVKAIHHVYISSRAEIGPGLLLMHYHSIVIGPAKIGCNSTLHHNSTIGEAVAKHHNSMPQIGDDVWIGPHCIVTGDIKVGNNVTLSAATFLSKDVPDNCLVAGNPGRVVVNSYDNTTMSVKRNKKSFKNGSSLITG